MKNRHTNTFLNTMIATGVALSVLSAGISAGYKYVNPKKSWAFAGLALAETACVGAWVWMKDKQKAKA